MYRVKEGKEEYMPTTYTHDLFGKEVFHRLPKECKDVIRQARSMYLIGLHGPDILFYYEPFHKNEVSDTAMAVHNETADKFFHQAVQVYRYCPGDALASYLMGFVCHYILDSACHPYVWEYAKQSGISHAAIETELDRYFMLREKKDPFTYNPLPGFSVTSGGNRVIASVFPEITPREVEKSLISMKKYVKLLVSKNEWKRNVLLGAMKLLGCYDKMEGQVMRKDPIAKCRESNGKLAALYEAALPEAVEAVTNIWHVLQDKEELSPRFQYNFE